MSPEQDPFALLREHINDRFDSMSERLTERFESLDRRIDERWGDTNRQVDSINRVLNGNGSPGLIRAVDRLEQRFRDVETGDALTARKAGSMAGGAAAFVVSVLVGLLTYFGMPKQ